MQLSPKFCSGPGAFSPFDKNRAAEKTTEAVCTPATLVFWVPVGVVREAASARSRGVLRSNLHLIYDLILARIKFVTASPRGSLYIVLYILNLGGNLLRGCMGVSRTQPVSSY